MGDGGGGGGAGGFWEHRAVAVPAGEDEADLAARLAADGWEVVGREPGAVLRLRRPVGGFGPAPAARRGCLAALPAALAGAARRRTRWAR